MTRQQSDGGAQGRIRCDLPTLAQFRRECYDWWRDGCDCTACHVIDSFESGESSHETMQWRLQLLHDIARGRHGDGVELPRVQLQLWLDKESRR